MKKYLVLFAVLLALLVGAWYVATVERPAGSPESVVKKPIATVMYSCNAGKIIYAVFYEGSSNPSLTPDMPPTPGGSVELLFNDRPGMTLAQTISADGNRYANTDESFVFWGKGNGALVLENNAEKSYIGCILVAPQPTGTDLSQIYSAKGGSFSLRFPLGYIPDETYQHELAPGRIISGVRFTIPSGLAKGTNLAEDSSISVETIPNVKDCNADLFLDQAPKAKEVTENNTTYSTVSMTDAAAGNRYEETIYAIPGTNPCLAIHYFIHYGAIENYPAGAVKEFDKVDILKTFDAIRGTFTWNQ